ncbi:MAG: sigma-70 family RNA polymerase sigma factor [Kiritimatiellae bacterium]|nr:sigma-70 family RNA polymerase sigma factor [Kiritimatiellia bacterium]
MADLNDILAARQAIERFIAENEGYVRAIASRLAPIPADADDLAQQVFLIAMKKLDTFDTGRDVKPWLAGIARNVCHKAWDAAKREYGLKRDALAGYLDQLADEPSPLYTDARKAALKECVDRLPDRQRRILELRYGMGLLSELIAGQIRSTATAVRMTLVRVRQQLKVCIEASLRTAEQ